MFTLKIKKIKPYGIRQSSWNGLFRGDETPYCFSYEKEEDLKKALDRYFDTSFKACEWNFHGIGYHRFAEGFFSNTHYISCSNCSGGQVNGSAEANIVEIKIIKESGDPASPKDGLFSTDILEKKYVLWDLEINAKCDKCDKKSHWYGVQTTHDGGRKSHWNFSHYSGSFSKIK